MIINQYNRYVPDRKMVGTVEGRAGIYHIHFTRDLDGSLRGAGTLWDPETGKSSAWAWKGHQLDLKSLRVIHDHEQV